MQTISDLNSKWWYRLLKVVSVFVLTFFILISVVAPYFAFEPKFNKETSYIQCDNGRKLSSDEFEIDSDYISPSEEDGLKFKCLYEDSGFNEEELAIANRAKDTGKDVNEALKAIGKYREAKFESERVSQMENNFTFIKDYESRNWLFVILASVGMLVATVGIFELCRRIFYYIILGRIKPE